MLYVLSKVMYESVGEVVGEGVLESFDVKFVDDDVIDVEFEVNKD